MHVYGRRKEIGFDHLSWLVSVDALRDSTHHDGSGDVPGIRYQNGEFDERPHRARVIHVNRDVLSIWRRLLVEENRPIEQARLLSPVSTGEASAISALADYPLHLGTLSPQMSRGYDESGAKKVNLIDYNRPETTTGQAFLPSRWREVILKGTQLGVANPIFKRHDANSNDAYGINLVSLTHDHVPDTPYVRVAGRNQEFLAAQDRWVDHEVLTRLRASQVAISRARKQIEQVDNTLEGSSRR
ncbi:hypothetical protein NKH18_47565 [Streptomyces sp. M10(2022)]